MHVLYITPGHREQLFVNAMCIDFVHGTIFAWTYLSLAGFPDREILKLLSMPPEAWCYQVNCAESTARSALRAAGLQLPQRAS